MIEEPIKMPQTWDAWVSRDRQISFQPIPDSLGEWVRAEEVAPMVTEINTLRALCQNQFEVLIKQALDC